jgi:hypothetical protein
MSILALAILNAALAALLVAGLAALMRAPLAAGASAPERVDLPGAADPLPLAA